MGETKKRDALDKLLDPNNSDSILLYDKDNEPTEFKQLSSLIYQGKAYALLKPIDKIACLDEKVALVFYLNSEKHELNLVTDQTIIDAVFNQYENSLKDKK